MEELAGNLEAAEHHMQVVCDLLTEAGEKYYASTYFALLARLAAKLGHRERALQRADTAESLAARGDWWVETRSRQARAWVAATDGDAERAVRLAAEAVDIARAGEYVSIRGGALMDYAELLGQAGHLDQARAIAREAHELFTHHGQLVLATSAQQLLDRLSTS